MHRSFGIEIRPEARTTWSTVKRGPSLSQVKEHLRKLPTIRGFSASRRCRWPIPPTTFGRSAVVEVSL